MRIIKPTEPKEPVKCKVCGKDLTNKKKCKFQGETGWVCEPCFFNE